MGTATKNHWFPSTITFVVTLTSKMIKIIIIIKVPSNEGDKLKPIYYHTLFLNLREDKTKFLLPMSKIQALSIIPNEKKNFF